MRRKKLMGYPAVPRVGVYHVFRLCFVNIGIECLGSTAFVLDATLS